MPFSTPTHSWSLPSFERFVKASAASTAALSSAILLGACAAAPQPIPSPPTPSLPTPSSLPAQMAVPSVAPGALYPVAVNPVAANPVNANVPTTLPANDAQTRAPVTFLSQQVGNKVALQGTFAGWTSCIESTQLTKGDWVIRFTDAGRMACAYVSGGVPQGIAPPPSTLSNGMPVSIQGVVKLAPSSGKPYVQYNPQ